MNERIGVSSCLAVRSKGRARKPAKMLGSHVTMIDTASFLGLRTPKPRKCLRSGSGALSHAAPGRARWDRSVKSEYKGSPSISARRARPRSSRARISWSPPDAARTSKNRCIWAEPASPPTAKNGIKVNEQLKTTNRRIYAIGDVVGGPQFTHLAVL